MIFIFVKTRVYNSNCNSHIVSTPAIWIGWAAETVKIKNFPNPSHHPLQFSAVPQHRRMTSIFETHTLPEIPTTIQGDLHRRTHAYQLPRDTVGTPPPPPQTQDDSPNTIQETPNSQFRLFISVMPCMPHKDNLKSVNRSPSPPLFSPTPASSLAHAPTYNSPQNQPLPLPLSPTMS